MFTIKLKKGREKSLLRKHPWIFSGSVANCNGNPVPGETVKIADSHGNILGTGSWSPFSMINIRIWEFGGETEINKEFFVDKIKKSLTLRKILGMDNPNGGFRLIASEADGLPGLTVDYYAGYLVCQFQSWGVEYRKNEIIDALCEVINPKGIYERSDTSARKKEKLEDSVGLLTGAEPPENIVINEKELKFNVDVRNGHKTGFYLDQCDNRQAVYDACKDKEVLNCFSYTGAFSAWAMKGGAQKVTDIDSSEPALETAATNYKLNGFTDEQYEQICGDVFMELRKFRDCRRSFDVIILDPPKFASSKGQVNKAARAYKDINMLALKLLRPNGRLFTFSCSGAITEELFQKIVADASVDAGRNTKIVKRLFQAADHPVSLNYPEGLYLKGLECIIDSTICFS